VLVCLVALLASIMAGFALARDTSDGTLSVRWGRGLVWLRIDGSVIGQVGRGTIRVYDPDTSDGSGPILKNCDSFADLSDSIPNPNGKKVVCAGTDLRFRLTGGFYRIKITGVGINVAAVAQGKVTLDGSGHAEVAIADGVFSLNDAPYQSLPDDRKTYSLAGSAGG
jgi:hypothetical protein